MGWGAGLVAGVLAAWAVGGTPPAPPAAQAPGQPFPWHTTPQPGEALTALPAPDALTAEAAPAPAAPAVMDLCGLGRLSLPGGAATDEDSDALDALPAPVGREPLAQARQALLARLHGGDASARVAGLLLDKPVLDDETARQAWAEALLQQARASQSAVALAWAEEACAYLPDGSACRLGLVRERLRLEPDNAHHWAALADEDPGAADEAWRGLLHAGRWQESPQALLVATQAALPRELPGYLRQALGVAVRTRAAALPAPGEGFVQERCREPQPGRQQECDKLARMLVDHGDSVHALSQAAQLAELAAWPREQVAAITHELQALTRPGAQWAPDPQQPLSCASADGWQRHVADVAQLGELGALRAHRTDAPGGP